MTIERTDYGIPVPSHEMETSSHEHPTAQDLEDAEVEAQAETALFLSQEEGDLMHEYN